tara:strand:- start:699 stop:929 length:231 start_codon:yes stop_codon:yes gene_type:complete
MTALERQCRSTWENEEIGEEREEREDDNWMEEIALNDLIREVGDCIQEFLALGLTRDDVEAKVMRLIDIKSEDRNR